MSDKQQDLLTKSLAKRQSVQQTSQLKTLALGESVSLPGSSIIPNDGDSGKVEGFDRRFRFTPVNENSALDTAEMEHGGIPGSYKNERHRQDLAESMDISPAVISDYTLNKDLALKAKERLVSALNNSGNVTLTNTKLDNNNRYVTTAVDEAGQDIIAPLAESPENNQAFNESYNLHAAQVAKGNEILAREEATKNSLSDKQVGTPLGAIANLGANLIGGAATVAGAIVNTPFEVLGFFNAQDLNDKDYALNKSIEEKFTKEYTDPSYVANDHLTPEEIAHISNEEGSDVSRYERINLQKDTEFITKRTDDLVNDINSIANKGDRDKAHKKAKAYYDYGIKGAFNEGVEAVSEGDLEQGVKSFSQAIQGVGLGVFNTITEEPIGVAQVFVESLPHMILANKKLGTAVLSTFTEKAAESRDKFVEANGRLPEGNEVTTLLLSDAAATAMDVGGDRYVFGSHKSIGKSSTAEGASEALTTEFEEYAHKQDINKIDHGEAFASGVLGFGSGGLVSGVTALPTVSSKVKGVADKATKIIKEASEKVTAVEQGDLSSLPLNEQVDNLLINTPDPKESSLEERVAHHSKMKKAYVAFATEVQNAPEVETEEDMANLQDTIAKVNRMGDQINAYKRTQIDSKPEDITTVVNASEPSKEVSEAITRNIGSMAIGYDTSIEDAQALADSPLLSDSERSKVNSYINTKKSMENVSKDVIHGGKGYIGITQHKAAVMLGVDENNKEITEGSLSRFGTWVNRHSRKADALNKVVNALKLGNETEAAKFLEEAKDLQTTSSKVQFNYDNPVAFEKFVDTVNSEVNALKTAYKEIASIAGNTFDGLTTSEVNKPKDKPSKSEQAVIDLKETGNIPNFINTAFNEETFPFIKEDILNSFKTRLPGLAKKLDIPMADAYAQLLTEATLANQGKELTESKTSDAVTQAFKPFNLADTILEGSKEVAGATLSNVLKATKRSTILTKYHNTFENFNKIPEIVDAPVEHKEALEKLKVFVDAFSKEFSKSVFTTESTVSSKVEGSGKTKAQIVKSDLLKKLKKNPALLLESRSKGIDFDENIKSAMALVSVEFLVTDGAGTIFNGLDAQRAILNLDDTDSIPEDVSQSLAVSGSTKNAVANSLGKKVLKHIGLKENSEVGRRNNISKLENVLGNYILDTLNKQGLVKFSSIDADVMSKAAGKKGKVDITGSTLFVRIATIPNLYDESKDTPVKAISNIVSTFKGSKEYIDSIFSTQLSKQMPSNEEPTRDQISNKVQDTNKRLTKVQHEAILDMAKTEQVMSTKINQITDWLGEQHTKAIAGYVEDLRDLHVTKRIGAKGKNQSIDNSFENLKEFRESETSKGVFYFLHKAVTQDRVHMVGAINTQDDKFHRWSIAPKEWETTLTTESNNGRDFYQFKLAVIASFGYKVEKINSLDEVTDIFEQIIDNNLDAINALKHLDSDNPKYKESVVQAVKAGKEDFHTLAGLSALRTYMDAAGKEFTTNLSREVDGITNGVLIGLVSLGSSNDFEAIKPKLAAAGLYEDSSMDFPTWVNTVGKDGKAVNEDNYEQITRVVVKKTDEALTYFNENSDLAPIKVLDNFVDILSKTTNPIEVVNTLTKYTGELIKDGEITSAGRDLLKNPLMIFLYGASIIKISKLISETILENIYSTMMKHSDDEYQLNIIREDLGKMLGKELPAITADNVRNYVLDFEDKKQFISQTAKLYEHTVGEAINEEFTALIKNIKTFNGAFAVIHQAFVLKYNKELAKLEKNGKVSTERVNKLVASLLKLYPSVATYMSTGISSELSFLRSKQSPDYTDEFKTQIIVKNKSKETVRKVSFDASGNLIESEVEAPKTYTGRGASLQFTEPGVTPGVLNTQNHDTIPIYLTANEGASLGVHDAKFAGIKDIEFIGSKMNSTFTKGLFRHDSFGAANTSLVRAMKALKNDPDILNVLDVLISTGKGNIFGSEFSSNGVANYSNISEYLKHFAAIADKLETYKQETISRIGAAGNYGGIDMYLPKGKPITVTKEESLNDIDQSIEAFIEHQMKEVSKLPNIKSQEEALKDLYIGSTNKAKPFDFTGTPSEILTASNSKNIFTNLGKLPSKIKDSKEHTEHLNTLLGSLVNKVLTPVNLFITKDGDTTYGQVSSDFKNIGINVAKNVSAKSSGIVMSAQTAYLHELIHTVTGEALSSNKNYLITRKLRKLMNHVKENISTDQLNKYEYVFNNTEHTYVTYTNSIGIEVKDRVNNGLLEFLAFSQTEPEFIEMLSTVPDIELLDVEGTSLKNKLFNILNQIFEYFNELFKGPDANTVTGQVSSLVNKLATTQIEQSNLLLRQFDITDGIDLKAIQLIKKNILNPLHKLLSNERLINSKNTVISNLSKTAELLPKTQFVHYKRVVNEVMFRLGYTEKSLISSILSEAAGNTKDVRAWHTLLKKSNKIIDQLRDSVAADVSEFVMETFHTKEITQKTKEAITKVFLKGDLDSILDGYGLEKLINFLTNSKELLSEIAKIEKILKQKIEGNYYIINARSLGKFMVTNLHEVSISGMFNVDQIANLDSAQGTIAPEENIEETKKLLTKLSRLYAIKFSDKKDLKLASEILSKELKADQVSNGITYTLAMHREYKEEYLDKVLGGKANLVIDGSIKDVYNPHHSVLIAPLKESSELIRLGYRRSDKPLDKDINDITKEPMYIFTSKIGGVNTYNKMVVSLTSKNATISDVSAGYSTDNGHRAVLSKETKSKGFKAAMLAEVQKQRKGSVTASVTKNSLVPVYNANRVIVGYKYLMNSKDKETLLEQDTTFNLVLGSMKANIPDKVNTEVINKEAVELAYADYKKGYKSDPTSFVNIGPNSTDNEYREIFKLLPKEMKRDIKTTWGSNDFYVRRELAKTIFGYRKLSITNWIRPSTDMEKTQFKVLRYMGDSLSKHMNLGKIKHVENVWQEVIKAAKDTIVIKNLSTLEGNIVSNNWLLWLSGVSKKDIYNYQVAGTLAIQDYLKEHKELSKINLAMRLNPNIKNKRGLMNRKNSLQDSIGKNPIKPLIDAGIFQTIVEDIAEDESLYTYKSKLDDLLDPLLKNVHKDIKSAGKAVALTHETQAYKFLKDATQFSDLVARYALHQHNLSKGVSEEESLIDIVDSFINYDLPTHPLIQYGNDMGFIMFSKFFIRIQKIIAKKVGKAPAKFIGLNMLENLIGNQSDITDSLVTPQAIYNKTNMPVNTVGAIVTELPTVNPFL